MVNDQWLSHGPLVGNFSGTVAPGCLCALLPLPCAACVAPAYQSPCNQLRIVHRASHH